MNVEAQVVNGNDPSIAHDGEVPDLEGNLARLRWKLVGNQFHRSTDHHGREALTSGPLDGNLSGHLAVAEHRDPGAQSEHLMKLVGDEDQPTPIGRELTKRDEELVDLLGSENRRRFVQDEQPSLAIERLQDLHTLTLTNGELPDEHRRIDVESVLICECSDSLGDDVEIGQEATARLESQRHVLSDRQGGHQHEVLMDHADAVLDRI